MPDGTYSELRGLTCGAYAKIKHEIRRVFGFFGEDEGEPARGTRRGRHSKHE